MDPMLYKAAMYGDMESLRRFIREYSPPELTLCLTPQKNTALHIAVEFYCQNIVEEVIQLYPSLISQQNSKGDTPLHVAARVGLVDLTNLLTPPLTEGNPTLEEGNPVRQAGSVALRMSNLEGNNPIHEALKKGHEEVALHLLAFEERHGLARDVNMARESLLYLAAEAGLEKVVQKIINTGDYSTQGPDGQNPLHISVIKGQLGMFLHHTYGVTPQFRIPINSFDHPKLARYFPENPRTSKIVGRSEVQFKTFEPNNIQWLKLAEAIGIMYI